MFPQVLPQTLHRKPTRPKGRPRPRHICGTARLRERQQYKELLGQQFASPYAFFLPKIQGIRAIESELEEPALTPPLSPRSMTPSLPVVTPLSRLNHDLALFSNEDKSLDSQKWTAAMLFLEVNRPSIISGAFMTLGGERLGFVLVKHVVEAISDILFVDEKSDLLLQQCFEVFARRENRTIVNKVDLDARRFARTERDGCTRAMIVALTRAIKHTERCTSDRRQFLSLEEFKKYFRGEEGTLAPELVVAFLPKLLEHLIEQEDV